MTFELVPVFFFSLCIYLRHFLKKKKLILSIFVSSGLVLLSVYNVSKLISNQILSFSIIVSTGLPGRRRLLDPLHTQDTDFLQASIVPGTVFHLGTF